MCTWGTTVPLEVTIPTHLSRTGEQRQKVVDVDKCIAPLVQCLNDAGLTTVACCCGHGKIAGVISLADGREIVIMTYEQMSAYFKAQPEGINPRDQSEG